VISRRLAAAGQTEILSEPQEAGMMRKVRVAIVTIAVAVSFAGFVQGQGKTDPALDKLGKEFMAAFNAKDAAKVASFYADDAVVMPPNQALVKGRANIEAYFKQEFQQGVTNLQLRPMESAIAGAQAFEAGTSTVTVKSGGSSMALTGVGGSGAAVTDNGKYLTVFKRVGGDWKIAYDIFNSDQPPPPAPKK
jgi:uncharacterized protein (TIGR02246 family)